MTSSKTELLQRDGAHLIHSLHDRRLQEKGHVWIKGKGAILTDADGKEYIDGLSGLWNVVAGHGRKELGEVAAWQMEQLPYCSGYAGSSNPRAIELAERLAGLTYPSINHFFLRQEGASRVKRVSKWPAIIGSSRRSLKRRKSFPSNGGTTV